MRNSDGILRHRRDRFFWLSRFSRGFLFFFFQAAANAAKRLIPLFDRVLVQRAEAVTKTKGGIVLPEKAQAKVLRGTVVATGPGSRNNVRTHTWRIIIF